MLIGNRYSDNKLYRGIKHYDGLPLTSGDLHEYSDILQMKSAYILNNLLGSGTLNEPDISISATGISLLSPSVLLIDGDISLVQANGDIVTISEIESSGISDGVVCIVGWYQSLTANSTLRDYGGVRNSIITNDILDAKLGIQVSTRYQLRWDLVIIDKSDIDSDESLTFSLLNRDESGEVTSGSVQITTNSKYGSVRVATKPSSMTYAVSDLYVVPILQYSYTSGNISFVKPIKALKPEGALGSMIKSVNQPTGVIDEGTIWYDPNTSRFKIYIEDVGFIPTASDYTLLQYRNTIIIDYNTETEENIRINIGIEQYSEKDILQVSYNGVLLTEGLHYTLHTDTKIVTLLGFTTEVGDQITFIVTKLVDTTDISTISAEFNTHANTVGNSTNKGHLSLTDTISSTLDETSGVAATPKSVYDSTIIKDKVTNKNYRLSISNAVLGIEEVT